MSCPLFPLTQNNIKYIDLTIKLKEDKQKIQARLSQWSTVQKLKQDISQRINQDPQQIKLFLANGELDDDVFLNQLITTNTLNANNQNNQQLKLYCESSNNNQKIRKIHILQNESMDKLIQVIDKALNKGVFPKKKNDGTSGMYQLKDSNRNIVAFFKPIDEEPVLTEEPKADLSVKNFKQILRKQSYEVSIREHYRVCQRNQQGEHLKQTTIRRGIFSGELAKREVFAFLLDNEFIHGVPPTALVEINQDVFKNNQSQNQNFMNPQVIKLDQTNYNFTSATKIGSLQKYQLNNGTVSNICNRLFSDFEVQKIALLDLRILNCDRNESNIIYKRNIETNTIFLYPIDHGLSLPDSLELYESDLCWINWSQVKQQIDPRLEQYIRNIDPKKDYYLLKQKLNIREASMKNFRIAEIFLKKCVENNLNIYTIANLMYRQNEQARSFLEKMVDHAKFTHLYICGQGNYPNYLLPFPNENALNEFSLKLKQVRLENEINKLDQPLNDREINQNIFLNQNKIIPNNKSQIELITESNEEFIHNNVSNGSNKDSEVQCCELYSNNPFTLNNDINSNSRYQFTEQIQLNKINEAQKVIKLQPCIRKHNNFLSPIEQVKNKEQKVKFPDLITKSQNTQNNEEQNNQMKKDGSSQIKEEEVNQNEESQQMNRVSNLTFKQPSNFFEDQKLKENKENQRTSQSSSINKILINNQKQIETGFSNQKTRTGMRSRMQTISYASKQLNHNDYSTIASSHKSHNRSVGRTNSKQQQMLKSLSIQHQVRKPIQLSGERDQRNKTFKQKQSENEPETENNELFFYFFECCIEQYIKQMRNKKQRRYTTDNIDV